MDHFTLIVVSDEASPVKRFRVSRKLLMRSAWVGAVVTVLAVGLLVDWVRVRIDMVDLDRLRVEAVQQQESLQGLSGQLGSLEENFEKIREFERKVRIIADLPGAMTEAETSGAEAGGQGGDEEVPEAEARPGGQGGDEEPAVPDPSEPISFDRDALNRLEETARELAVALAPQQASLEALVAGLQGKSHRLASTPSIWPTKGWVTSSFGYRTSPFTGRRQFHSGLDIAADFGTTIFAPARGRVAFVGRKGPLGNAVILDHGFGTKTTYGHAAETFVKTGQEVERGARIAAVGSTGRSTGPHLHYGVSINGKSVNPSNYIFE